MSYRLTLEATIEATSNREALRLMAEKLLDIVAKEDSWPTPGYLGGIRLSNDLLDHGLT